MKIRLFTTLFFCLAFGLKVQAQVVCNGVLGDHILNADFGVGVGAPAFGGFPTSITQFTNLQIGPTSTLNAPNTSMLIANTNFLGGAPEWADNKSDHTGSAGSPNSTFWAVRLPDVVGEVLVERELTNLCPNTVLEISMWLMNLMGASHPDLVNALPVVYPDLTLRILDASNNIVLLQSTGIILANEIWEQYPFYFNTANHSYLKVQILSNSEGGTSTGNYLGIDDITIRPCVPLAEMTPQIDTLICDNNTLLNFSGQVESGMFNNVNYQWQMSTNQGSTWINMGNISQVNSVSYSFMTNSQFNHYWFRFLASPVGVVQASNCRSVSDTSFVTVDSIISNIWVETERNVCDLPGGYRIDALHTLAHEYLWSTGGEDNYTIIPEEGKYWLKVTSKFGCISIDTININFIDISSVTLGEDTSFCEGTKHTMDVSFDMASSYVWSTGSTSPSITVEQSGQYWVRVFGLDCTISDTVNFSFNEYPQIDLGDTISLCRGGEHYLSSDIAYPIANYQWNTGDKNSVLKIEESGKYWVTVTNPPNCEGTDTVYVNFYDCECNVFIPNAFTPNGDGFNDSFKPSLAQACVKQVYRMQIFNRFGKLLFETNEINKGWNGKIDGKEAPMDTYMYIIRYADNTSEEVSKVYTGDFHLLR